MTMARSNFSSTALTSLKAEEGLCSNDRRPSDYPEKTTWLHAISHLDPKYGGVSAVVPQLDAAIAETRRYAIRLAAFCERGEDYAPAPAPDVSVEHLPLARSEWRSRPSAATDLDAWVAASSGVHIHGLWQRSTAVTSAFARKNRKPYVLSAHGMLEPWALANKRWKKQVYLALVEKANLAAAACLHALTQAEVNDYRRLGLRNPVAVIPNGVHIPEQQSSQPFFAQFPGLAGKRLILFLGRIHFKKGLDILCQAWTQLATRWPDAHLILAGPDFENTQASVELMVCKAKLADRVTFTGMLAGKLKWSALAAAEFFVLPSYSEGLSVSVLEAMGMGKPVLITENCNLPEVGGYGCGAIIRATAGELEAAMEAMLRQSRSARLEMGARGERLVQTRYSWTAIGEQMAGLYEWLEGGSKPSQVDIDMGAGR